MRVVVWSDAARQDYLDILRYIAQSDPVAAEKVVEAIDKAGNDLGSFATGRPGRVTDTYEKLVPGVPYIIGYSLAVRRGRKAIAILRVIHAARDWQDESWPA